MNYNFLELGQWSRNLQNSDHCIKKTTWSWAENLKTLLWPSSHRVAFLRQMVPPVWSRRQSLSSILVESMVNPNLRGQGPKRALMFWKSKLLNNFLRENIQKLGYSWQGCKFAHWFSEQITCFLWKNEQISNSLKKTSDLLIFSERPERFAHGLLFLVCNLSESLMVVHFWWAIWGICSHRSFLVSDLSNLLTLLIKKRESANRSFF